MRSGSRALRVLRTARFRAFLLPLSLLLLGSATAFAQEGAGFIPIPLLQFGLGVAESPRDVATTLQILALLTVLSVAPGIIQRAISIWCTPWLPMSPLPKSQNQCQL